MLARFDLQYRHRPTAVRFTQTKPDARSNGWLIVTLLTVLFVLWLVYRRNFMPDLGMGRHAFIGELLRLLELAGGATLAILWGVLIWRRRHSKPVSAPTLDREDLYDMSPREFEKYVAWLFRRKGYAVKMRGGSGDRGVDLELRKRGGKRAIVQCKRYRSQLGPDIARELFGTLIHERAAHAFLVTTADISKSTRDWATGKPLTLIDGDTLLDLAAALETEEVR